MELLTRNVGYAEAQVYDTTGRAMGILYWNPRGDTWEVWEMLSRPGRCLGTYVSETEARDALAAVLETETEREEK